MKSKVAGFAEVPCEGVENINLSDLVKQVFLLNFLSSLIYYHFDNIVDIYDILSLAYGLCSKNEGNLRVCSFVLQDMLFL